MPDEGLALPRLCLRVEESADDDVAVSVAVNVTRRGGVATELAAALVALCVPVRRRAQARGRAVEDVGPAVSRSRRL